MFYVHFPLTTLTEEIPPTCDVALEARRTKIRLSSTFAHCFCVRRRSKKCAFLFVCCVTGGGSMPGHGSPCRWMLSASPRTPS